MTTYQFSGPNQKTPAKGATVRGKIYIPSCQPGATPIANYTFEGEFRGECADGFMVRPTWRSDGGADMGTIICRTLHDADKEAADRLAAQEQEARDRTTEHREEERDYMSRQGDAGTDSMLNAIEANGGRFTI